MARILLVDDEAKVRRSLAKVLTDQGIEVQAAGTGRDAEMLLRRGGAEVAIVDFELGAERGDDVTRRLLEIDPGLAIIGYTGKEATGVGSRFLQAGARAYVEKGAPQQGELFQQIKRLLSLRADEERASDIDVTGVSPRVRAALANLPTKSRAMRELHANLLQVASLNPKLVMLRGEPGVGKTHAARLLHAAWAEPRTPFVEINAAGLSRDNVGPTLFGSEGGRFTGVEDNQGAFGSAGKGTLFLDEIGELTLDVQKSLLTVIQDSVYTRSGGTKQHRFEGHLVVATNRDLRQQQARGEFREDLRWRLDRFVFEIPPLRERREDIMTLAYTFLDRYAAQYNRTVRRIPPDTAHLLNTHQWPGNVRELDQVVDRAVASCRGPYLEVRYLTFRDGYQAVEDAPEPPSVEIQPVAPTALPGPGGRFDSRFDLPYTEAKNALVADFTTAYVRHKLAEANGNKTLAAENAGLKPPNLHRLIRNFDIDTSDLAGDRDVKGGRG